jgi:hypothetical protein
LPETRHRTVLEIGVDDREVRGLGATMDRTFSTTSIDAFERSLERTSRTLGKLVEQQNKLLGALSRMTGAGGGFAGPGVSGGGAGGFGGPAGPPAPPAAARRRPGRFLQRTAATALGTSIGMAGAGLQGQGFAGMMAAGIPVVGPMLLGATQGIRNFYGAHVQQQMARAGAVGQAGVGAGGFNQFQRAGIRLGYGPSESPGVLGGIGAQTGMVGQDLMNVAPRLARAQRVMGFQNLGNVLGGAGAAGPGGGAGSPFSLMADAVFTGVSGGIREARLDRFFSQFGSWIEGLRTSGIQISASSLMQLVRGTSMLGRTFQGEAGAQAAQGFMGAMRGAGGRQGQGALMALRAGGLRGGGFGNRTFMQAREWMQQNPAQAMSNFMQMFRQVSRGATPDEASLFAEQIWSSLGMQLEPGQARDFAQAAMDPGGGPAQAFLQQFDDARAGDDRVQSMIERRTGQAAGVLATPRAEAGYEAQRAGVGGRPEIIRAMRNMRTLEVALAKEFLPAVAGFISGAIGFLRRALAAFQQGGMAGLTTFMARETIPPAADAVDTVLEEAQTGLASILRRSSNPTDQAVAEMLEGYAAQGTVRANRGISAGSEGQSRAIQEAERRNVPRSTRQRMLNRMQAGETSPGDEMNMLNQMFPADNAVGDPTSMIINGLQRAIEGARRLHDQQLPGEGDLTRRPA